MRVAHSMLFAAGAATMAVAGCSASISNEDGPGWSLAETGSNTAAIAARAATRPFGVTNAGASEPSAVTSAGARYDNGGTVRGPDSVAKPALTARPTALKPDVGTKSDVAVKSVTTVVARPTALPTPPVTSALPTSAATRPRPSTGREAIVVKGDTLHGLSTRHRVSVKALMTANSLTSAKIFPGQKLVIPDAP